MTTDEGMLDRLRDSEVWQSIVRADAATRDGERDAAVQALIRIAAHVAKEKPRCDRACAAADQEVADATTSLIAAHRAAATAREARFSLLTGSTNASTRHEHVLRRHAPVELKEFLDWAQTERQRLRSRGVITSREVPGPQNLIDLKRSPRVATNAGSVSARMAALNAAVIAALALQTAPLSVEEVRAAVITLRKSIPALETTLV